MPQLSDQTGLRARQSFRTTVARLTGFAAHPVFVACLGVMLTAAGTWLVHRDVKSSDAARFDSTQRRFKDLIVLRLEVLAPVIKGAQSLVISGDGPSAELWADYMNAMDDFIRRGVITIDYFANVSTRAETPPGASAVLIRQREIRARYRNMRLGTDPWSDQVQRDALLRASKSGEIVASDVLLSDGSGRRVWLLAKAVFRKDADRKTEPGINSTRGWVTALLDAANVFYGLEARLDNTVGFTIYAGPAVPECLLYRSVTPTEAERQPAFRKVITMEIYDRTWTAEIHSLPRFMALAKSRHRTNLVLGGGLLLTAAIAGLTWSLSASRDRALKLANEMTADLRLAMVETKRAVASETQGKAKLKFLFDSIPVGILMEIEGDSGPPLVNPAYGLIVGNSKPASSRELFMPKTSLRPDLITPQNISGTGQLEYLNGSVERQFRHADGKVVWAMIASRVFNDLKLSRKLTIITLVDITAGKVAEAKLAEANALHIDLSRRAGMSEVASSVLHNVGNVLNSANVSITLIADWTRQSKVEGLMKITELLREHATDPGTFLTTDPRGRKVIEYLQLVGSELGREKSRSLAEIGSLRQNIDHIKDIVAMQQSYAKVSGLSEKVAVVELVEDALRMDGSVLSSRSVVLDRDYQVRPVIIVEKQHVLQILVNLLRNAHQACEETGRADLRITVQITETGSDVEIAVIDNGIGIAPELLTRIFNHGYTTKYNGHGIGLHNSALAAKNMGGELRAESPGPACGATFTLKLPRTDNSRPT